MPQAKPRQRATKPAIRREYIAAVRYKNGSKDLFYVRNADNLEDARAVVAADLIDAKMIMIALKAIAPENLKPDK